jgi:hypothetical protein
MAVSLSALHVGRPLPPGGFLVPISITGRVDPRDIEGLEGLDQLKQFNDLIVTNPRHSGLQHSASTIYANACPNYYKISSRIRSYTYRCCER